MLPKSFKSIFTFAAVAGGMLALSACSISGVGMKDGVPLSELDMEGATPTKLQLAGPDTVTVTQGEALDIDVSGSDDAVKGLRFRLEGNSLAIGRDSAWNGPGSATIAVTMPSLREISMAGSGKVTADSLTGKAEINVAGSGDISVARVAATSLSVNIMGSGDVSASGRADRLDYNVAGSGSLKARELQVGDAEINIAGSGDGIFASNGKVDGSVAGSGDVVVYGKARCSVKSVGSGTVRCRDAD